MLDSLLGTSEFRVLKSHKVSASRIYKLLVSNPSKIRHSDFMLISLKIYFRINWRLTKELSNEQVQNHSWSTLTRSMKNFKYLEKKTNASTPKINIERTRSKIPIIKFYAIKRTSNLYLNIRRIVNFRIWEGWRIKSEVAKWRPF